MYHIKATLIYLDDGILISKKRYLDWQDIQKEYGDRYKTSLPPMTCEEIICFFREDFGKETDWPFSRNSLLHFFEDRSKMTLSSSQSFPLSAF